MTTVVRRSARHTVSTDPAPRWVVLVEVADGDVGSIRVLGSLRRGARADVLAPRDDPAENDRRRRVVARLVDRATAWSRLPPGHDVDEGRTASETVVLIETNEGRWVGEARELDGDGENAAALDTEAGEMYLVEFSEVNGRPIAGFAPTPRRSPTIHRVLPIDDHRNLDAESSYGDDPIGAAITGDTFAIALRTVRRSWLGIGCSAAFIAIGLLRFSTFTSGRGPATIDSGNWLAFAESFMGAGQRDPSITYPPFVPLLTHVSVEAFGLTAGIALLAAISSLIPAAGLYIALSMAHIGPARIIPTLLVAGFGSVGEAASWGGFPQLWSMGVLPIGVVAAATLYDQPTWRRALFTGTALMLALSMSHLGALVLVASLLVSFALDFSIHRSTDRVRAVVGVAPLVLLPSAWLIPTYLKLIDAVVFDPNEFANLDNLTIGSTISGLADAAPQLPVLWPVAMSLGVLVPFLMWPVREHVAWRSTTTLLVAIVALIVVTRESRYLPFVPFVTAALVGVWIDDRLARPIGRAHRHRWAVALLVLGSAAAIGTQFAQTHRALATQRDFYGWLSDDLVTAIRVADDVSPDAGVLAIPSLNDAPIGWWVEGLTDHDVIYGSPLRWLNFSNEIDRATTANAIFSPTFPEATSLERLSDIEVSVVILPRRWAWFDERAVNEWIISNELVVRFDSDDVLVIDLGAHEAKPG